MSFSNSIQLTRCSWLAIGRPLVRAEPRMTGLTRSCFVSCSIVIATGSEPGKPIQHSRAKLAFFNEGRREAVDQRTALSNAIKSQLKVYFPLALVLLNADSSTALAADLLLRWPNSANTLRKFFYGHNC